MRLVTSALCAIIAGCASTPPKPASIPPELIPPGFTAADCWIAKPAETETVSGPGGAPVAMGSKSPEVQCTKHGQGATTTKTVPTCHTQAGKTLPLSDCCMTESGAPLPACTPKLQPPGE